MEVGGLSSEASHLHEALVVRLRELGVGSDHRHSALAFLLALLLLLNLVLLNSKSVEDVVHLQPLLFAVLHYNLVPYPSELNSVSDFELEPVWHVVVLVRHHVPDDQPQLFAWIGLLFFDVFDLIAVVHPVVVFLEQAGQSWISEGQRVFQLLLLQVNLHLVVVTELTLSDVVAFPGDGVC